MNISKMSHIEDKKPESDETDKPVAYKLSYRVGVSENRNLKYRSSMEDVHTYVANFVERLDWGYFALFDGHAGKSCAKWCGQNLHLLLEKELIGRELREKSEGEEDIRDSLDAVFQQADQMISNLPAKISGSGSTAAVAVIRWELDPEFENKQYSSTSQNFNFRDVLPELEAQDKLETGMNRRSYVSPNYNDLKKHFDFVPSPNHKRVLYTANVGDSRLVLCRNGLAVRLSYDHKGSDKNELNRVLQSGGLMMKNRVNGVLAVTRALGDLYLKNLIIGRPYTTAIEINENDEFLIVACDGLWDVLEDQAAVDLVRGEYDPEVQSKMLVDHAMKNLSTDNITCMVVRFDNRVFKI